MSTTAAQSRLAARAHQIIEEELEAWDASAADVRSALAAAKSLALYGGPTCEWQSPADARERAQQCAAYALLRIARELGHPVEAAGGRGALALLEDGL